MKIEPNDIINAMEEVDGSGNHYHTHYGLTKREYFAAIAMQGILADQSFIQPNQHDEIAKYAVQNADALINELNNL